jgi:murein DD-endopeptidase MepM/ murein hydrolase activator NlpD
VRAPSDAQGRPRARRNSHPVSIPRITVLVAASAAVVALIVPVALGQSLADRKNAVDSRISGLRDEIARAKAREGVLSTEISSASSHIAALEGDIGSLTARLTALESDLAAHRSQLARLQARFREQTEHLRRLTREHTVAQQRLEDRLVALYETSETSELEVLLQAQSFSDLLEQLDYFRAIGDQDKRIADTIKRLQIEMRITRQKTAATKADVASATAVLARKTEEQRAARDQLVAQQSALAAARASKQSLLADVRQERHADEEDLAAMQKASAAITAQLQSGGSSSSSGGSGPSASGFIWPVSGPVTSGFGWRWGRLHEGIDIGAACGTPIRAAASGSIVYAGWMDGYGNIVVIDHGGGIATAYAHQSAIYASGGSVSQGQVIGAVGSTGHSTGCHLHFEVRVNGTPVNPLNYL